MVVPSEISLYIIFMYVDFPSYNRVIEFMLFFTSFSFYSFFFPLFMWVLGENLDSLSIYFV